MGDSISRWHDDMDDYLDGCERLGETHPGPGTCSPYTEHGRAVEAVSEAIARYEALPECDRALLSTTGLPYRWVRGGFLCPA